MGLSPVKFFEFYRESKKGGLAEFTPAASLCLIKCEAFYKAKVPEIALRFLGAKQSDGGLIHT